ncbi:hypothetical protein H4R34_003684 [Dimargaris verticillata]|uniref:VLRF1 domain-containing protein n=1 Tax=Dimargaris verticillata TaxID=2761393 RepID=A0A9W8E8U6_9FUNG|nr:hypothetical protein H4R34_003684 [Dimargaris verticillata]
MRYSVFCIPAHLLAGLEQVSFASHSLPRPSSPQHSCSEANTDLLTVDLVCRTCRGMEFATAQQKRAHLKSTLHVRNLRAKIAESEAAADYDWQAPALATTDSVDSSKDTQSPGDDDLAWQSEPQSDSSSDTTGSSLLPSAGPKPRLSAIRPRVSTLAKVYRQIQDPLKRYELQQKAEVLGETLALEPMAWFKTSASAATDANKVISPPPYLGVLEVVLGRARRRHYSQTAPQTPYAADAPDDNPVVALRSLQMPASLAALSGERTASQVSVPPTSSGSNKASDMGQAWAHRWWTVLMIGGGRFAGAVFENASGRMVHHKTIQRYTTRRKQGGAQSKNDRTKGHAKSAGAQLRRHNQAAFEQDVLAIFKQWQPALEQSCRVFIAIPKAERNVYLNSSSRHMFGESGKFTKVEPVPFATARPTLDEVQRVYQQLTVVQAVTPNLKGLEADLAKLQVTNPTDVRSNVPTTVWDRLTASHSRELMALMTTGTPAQLMDYLCQHNLNLNAILDDGTGFTLLHHASQLGLASWVTALLNEGADPGVRSVTHNVLTKDQQIASSSFTGQLPYSLCANQATRDAFGHFRHARPTQWDWQATDVLEKSPPPTAVAAIVTEQLPLPALVSSTAAGSFAPEADFVAGTSALPEQPAIPTLPAVPPLPTLPQFAGPAPTLPTTTIIPRAPSPSPPPRSKVPKRKGTKPTSKAAAATTITTTASTPSAAPSLLDHLRPSVVWGALSTLPTYLTGYVGQDFGQATPHNDPSSSADLQAKPAALVNSDQKPSSSPTSASGAVSEREKRALAAEARMKRKS